MARRLIPIVMVVSLLWAGTPAQGQSARASGGVGGFACQFESPQWPGEAYAPCRAGLLPNEGTAWGSWAIDGATYVCSPTCTFRADFLHDPGICPLPGWPPALTTGTGTMLIDEFEVDFDWALAGTALVIVPRAGGTSASGSGSFVPVPPLATCAASMQQVAHVTATVVTST